MDAKSVRFGSWALLVLAGMLLTSFLYGIREEGVSIDNSFAKGFSLACVVAFIAAMLNERFRIYPLARKAEAQSKMLLRFVSPSRVKEFFTAQAREADANEKAYGNARKDFGLRVDQEQKKTLTWLQVRADESVETFEGWKRTAQACGFSVGSLASYLTAPPETGDAEMEEIRVSAGVCE